MRSETTCPYHPSKLIIGYCSRCGRPVCELCSVRVDDDVNGGLSFSQRYKRVKELLNSMSVETSRYLCRNCYRIKPRFSLQNLIYLGSGALTFLLGLFFEFIFLALIGAIVLIIGVYNIVAS
ncbi:MAG: B-box zinc finger protein [Candidatus Odinarchaeota archaeon]